MSWEKLILHTCNTEQVEHITEALDSLQALSVSLLDSADKPILEPGPGETPLWNTCEIEALFDSKDLLQKALTHLQTRYPDLSSSTDTLLDQDWERVCLDQFKPICYGDRLWITPSWYPENAEQIFSVRLDPGLAFGTGTHPTTTLCLEWLDRCDVHQKTFIDFGCGSGILSLAALKLGAQHVTAVDIDPQALLATEQNARLNQLSQKQLDIIHPEHLSETPVDIIIANILLTPLLSLKDTFYSHLLPRGKLVISGLYIDQTQPLIDHYTDLFTIETVTHKNEWGCLELTKKVC